MVDDNLEGKSSNIKSDQLHRNVFFIVIIYLISGGLWIYVSDIILAIYSTDLDNLTKLQTYKGWFYVIVTSILLFYLVDRFYRKINNFYYKSLEAHKSLQLIFDNIGSIIWTVDHDLRFTSSYGSGLIELNLRYNEVVGKTLYEYFNEQSNEFQPIAAHIRALKGYSESFEVEWGGNTYQCRLEPLRDKSGKVISVVGVAVDITERKRMEERIKTQLSELLQWKSVMLEREDKIMDLKKQVNELLVELGRPVRYTNV